jgi:hypothetical protein
MDKDKLNKANELAIIIDNLKESLHYFETDNLGNFCRNPNLALIYDGEKSYRTAHRFPSELIPEIRDFIIYKIITLKAEFQNL